jgi:hypothetical protein
VDPAIEHHRGLLLNVTEQGLTALQAAWMATPANIRKVLGDNFKEQLKASAAAFDESRKSPAVDTPSSIAALNSSDQSVENDQQSNGHGQPEYVSNVTAGGVNVF